VQRSAGDQLSQRRIERVLRVSAVEPLVTVAASRDQIGGVEFCELVLHGLEREMTQTRELPDLELLSGIREQQLKDLRAHQREQSVQERPSHHAALYLDRFKRSSFFYAGCGIGGSSCPRWVRMRTAPLSGYSWTSAGVWQRITEHASRPL